MTLHKNPVYIVAAFVFFIMHIALFAEKPKDTKHTLSYRGMRMSNADSLFYVTKIETETEQSDMFEIEIKFNIPADPRTLQKNISVLTVNFYPLRRLLLLIRLAIKWK